MSVSSARWGTFVVLLLAVAGAVLRFATLDQQSYWYDEAVTASLLDGSLLDVFRGVVDTESTPPLYYVLGWLWAQLLGTDELSLRSLSALLGTLVVPVAYAAGRVVSTARIGMAAAALAAVSPMLVWYSQEARAYSLLVLLGGASFVLFALARTDPSRRHLTWWAVIAALAIATHYFAVFVVLAEAIMLLSGSPRLVRLRWAIGSVMAFGLCLLPLAAIQASHRRLGWVGGLDLRDRLTDGMQRLVTGARPSSWAGATGADVTPYAWTGAVAVLGVVAWLVARRASQDERSGAIVALVVAGVAIGVPVTMALAADSLTGGDGDYFLDRNVLGAWVPLGVFIAGGLAARQAGLLGAAGLAAVVSWSLLVNIDIAQSHELQRDDWRAVADALPDDRSNAVVVYPAYQSAALTRQRPDLTAQNTAESVDTIVLVLAGFDEPPQSFRAPDEFVESRATSVQHFTIVEYWRDAPAELRPGDVAVGPLADADLEVLVSAGEE